MEGRFSKMQHIFHLYLKECHHVALEDLKSVLWAQNCFVFFTKQRFIWLWNNTRVSKQCQFSFMRDLIPYTYVHNVPTYFSNCVTVFVRGDCSLTPYDLIYSWKSLTLASYSCACFTFFGKPVTRKPFPWRTVDAMASHNRSSSVSLNTHTRENQMNTHIQIHNPWEQLDALEQTHTLD